jgi:hypothetical protein
MASFDASTDGDFTGTIQWSKLPEGSRTENFFVSIYLPGSSLS